MSSKVKIRLRELIDEQKLMKSQFERAKWERQQFVRALVAVALGSPEGITITKEQAAAVEDSHRINITHDYKTGNYHLTVINGEVERDNASTEQLGSGSVEVGVQERGGDVEGSLPQTLSERVGGEVREGDQYNSCKVRILPDSEEAAGRGEQPEG